MEKKKNIYIIGSVVVLCLVFAVPFFYKNSFKKDTKKEELIVVEVDPEVKKKTEEQIPTIREEVKKNPESASAIQILARAELRLGNVANAEEAIEKAISLDSKNPTYYADLGVVLREKKDISGAIEQYQKSISLMETRAQDVPDQFKNFPKEMLPEEFKNGTSNSFIPTPFMHLSNIYIEQNKNERAIEVLELGVKYIPTYPDFYLRLSGLYKNIDLEKSEIYRKQFEALIK